MANSQEEEEEGCELVEEEGHLGFQGKRKKEKGKRIDIGKSLADDGKTSSLKLRCSRKVKVFIYGVE